jgi:hypothetical protein
MDAARRIGGGAMARACPDIIPPRLYSEALETQGWLAGVSMKNKKFLMRRPCLSLPGATFYGL